MSEKHPGPLVVEGKLTDAERMKLESNYLRGTIAEDLNDGLTGGFKGDNFLLIRFHGMYQQDDRDIRAERAEQKLEPRHAMLLRCRLPGGVITTKQWQAIDKFAGENTIYGSIRLTNRQTFQFHGILKKNVKPVHQMLHSVGLDALATANDMNRNVLCTSNPYESELHAEAYEWAKKISEHLLPRTRAYAEIWLDQEKVATTDEEPILGQTYLPRKFKTTVVIPPQNDIDLHANDMNFVAIAENGKLIGFNLLVGGGLSIEHGNKKTYARTASEFGFLPLEHTLAVAEAVVTTQRDWGNRTDRKNAKTKYTLERVGVETFKAEVERRAGIKFEPIRPYEFTGRGDRIGWVKGIDNKWHLTLFIENGRILDYPGRPLKTGLLEIAKIHKGEFRITANQNLIIAGVPESQKAKIEKLARDHGLMDAVKPQRENSMACVSFPTCPLAMAEAERFLPSFTDKVEAILEKTRYSGRAYCYARHRLPERLRPRDAGRAGSGRERRRVVTTCTLAVTVWGRAFRVCTVKILRNRKFLIPSTSLSGAGRKSAKRVKASATLRCVRAIIRPGARSRKGFLGVTTRGNYVRIRSKRP
ncbi:sulfite reductase subunit beta [Enterobacter asburiae]|uniref:Sulfite reductase subunit beta n=2 Tax=Gammaproteobacteria TaxID=1236 RepID=A0A376FAW2_ENTAS|nr:sulfite reductase subunit beta [Enterobacter asburiae]